MADPGAWQPLLEELALWRGAGRAVRLWLRDDDAVRPTAALDRLFALCAGMDVPVTLAVIPAAAGQALAESVGAAQGVTVAVHGWSHENHAPPDEKKQELGLHRPASAVLGELARGIEVTRDLFGRQALAMLVPPWNRIAPALLQELPGLGFACLSVFGSARPAPVSVLNTHVDLIDWHGGRRGKDHGLLVAELVAEMSWRRGSGSDEPIGILAHHLDHDETAWTFLARLLEVTSSEAACQWFAATA